MVFLPILFKASASPIVMVDFPSPAGVGLMAVTKINLPTELLSTSRILSKLSLALYFPYNSKSSYEIPSFSTTSTIGFSSILCAISISVFIQNSSTSNVLTHYIIKQDLFIQK